MNLMSLKDATLRIALDSADTGSIGQETFSIAAALLQRGYAVSVGRRHDAARDGLLVLSRSPANDQSTAVGAARDITGLDAAQVMALVDEARAVRQAVEPGAWKPWFPVIDYERGTNCMQCLSFCLFGVYGVDEQQRITVQTNDNCKTNCPACSRVCPEAAILFPKYKSGPINGDVVNDSDLQREKMKIDISALLGGDVYSMLRERTERAKSRFSKERDSNKALDERKKCLTKLAQVAEIPAEVLMSLPSPDEIARRAEEAKAKAQAALQRSASAET